VAQNLLLKLSQLGTRLNTDVLDKPPPRILECLERLRLAAAAVKREHQLPGQTFAPWVVRHQAPQLAHQRVVPAGLEIGRHARLKGGEPLFLQARDVRLRKRFEGQVGEWCPPP
jgi:hypothetical protein